jgi:hypothetical protein
VKPSSNAEWSETTGQKSPLPTNLVLKMSPTPCFLAKETIPHITPIQALVSHRVTVLYSLEWTLPLKMFFVVTRKQKESFEKYGRKVSKKQNCKHNMILKSQVTWYNGSIFALFDMGLLLNDSNGSCVFVLALLSVRVRGREGASAAAFPFIWFDSSTSDP